MTSAANIRPIRVLLVDDHGIVREGLRAYLELESDIDVVGEARDGQEAVRRAQELQPDVVLMDLEMPVLDGYAAARLMKEALPSCRIIALSIHEDAASRQKSVRAGMDSFVSKAAHLQEVLDAIRAAGRSPNSIATDEGERS